MASRKKAAGTRKTGRGVERVEVPRGFTLVKTVSLPEPAQYISWSPQSDEVAVLTFTSRLFRVTDSAIVLMGTFERTRARGWAFSPQGHRIAISWEDSSLSVYDTSTLVELWHVTVRVGVGRVSWSPDGQWVAIGTADSGAQVLDPNTGRVIDTLISARCVYDLAASPDGALLSTGGHVDGVLRIWNAHTWQERSQPRAEQAGAIWTVAWSPNGQFLAVGLSDGTVHIVQEAGLRTVAILEGHTQATLWTEFSRDSRFLITCSESENRLWSTHDWSLAGMFTGSGGDGATSAFHPSDDQLLTLSPDGKELRFWRYQASSVLGTSDPTSGRYVNAKVVLVGDTGVGKSGLGLVLSNQDWTETGSTHGRHVWVFGNATFETASGQRDTRETLLWDLAGQPDYRLVHQLHLNDVATALVVFDSRSQTDPLAGVRYWNRALRQASQAQGERAVPMKKFLVAARSDVGRVGLSADRVQKIVDEFGFDAYFETSAKETWGIDELRTAIANSIDWSALPIVSSNTVFEEIKQFLLAEKAAGRLLSTSDDLYRSFAAKRKTGDLRAEFDTCIGRLESRGLIQRLSFGDLVLLQPEIRDAYASALVSAAKDEPDGLGSIREEDARTGNFKIPKEQRLANASLENLLLIATVEDLLRHEIALREHGDDGPYLVFPSQLTRENPALPDAEGKAAIFTFDGPVMNIYATLTVRLSHSGVFRKKELWKNAATYSSLRAGTYGVFLKEIGDGGGELTLFYENASDDLKLQFEQYVHAHLRRRAIPDTIRLRRIYVCPACETAVSDAQVQRRRAAGFQWINCNVCEPPRRIPIEVVEEAASAPPSPKLAEMDRAADAQRDMATATSVIEGKRQTKDFDVFLCHNSADKPAVKEVAAKLKERGILPWLDEWEVPPFARWQDELEKVIESVKSVAVFIGSSDRGPWQDMEIQAALQEAVNRKMRIGLVLLPGATKKARLPMFLKPFNWIDFNQQEPDPLAQLIWGITGERPSTYTP